jgi:hypothetical protein
MRGACPLHDPTGVRKKGRNGRAQVIKSDKKTVIDRSRVKEKNALLFY